MPPTPRRNRLGSMCLKTTDRTVSFRLLCVFGCVLLAGCQNVIVDRQGVLRVPVISPAAGIYGSPQTVSIHSFDDDVELRYTLDESDPTETSSILPEGMSINVSSSTTVKARAFKTDKTPSGTASARFSIVWEEKSPYPTSVQGARAETVDGKAYIFGGHSGSAYLNSVYEYDAGTNTWRAMSSIPGAARGFSMSACDGSLIYLAGGYSDSGELSELLVFDPDAGAAGTWTTKASMPGARWGGVAFLTNGYLYIAGGGAAAQKACFRYSVSGNTWSTLPATSDIPHPFGFVEAAGCVDSSGRLYLFGGWDLDTNQYYSSSYRYDPADATPSWVSRASMPKAAARMGFAASGDGIYLFGGDNKTSASDDVLYYSFSGNEYSAKTVGFEARYGAAATYIGTRVMLIGGKPFSSGPLTQTYIYLPSEDL